MKVRLLVVPAMAATFFLVACGKGDLALQNAVTAKLDAENLTGVTVMVKDGVVTLNGETTDAVLKSKAESLARIDGIKSVINNVSVKPGAKPSDQTMITKLEDALRKADCTGASVEIGANGKVIVTGIVAEAKYGECFLAVLETGVTDIENQLKKSK